MDIFARCPNASCGRRYKLKAEAVGKKAKCKECGQAFVVTAEDSASPSATVEPIEAKSPEVVTKAAHAPTPSKPPERVTSKSGTKSSTALVKATPETESPTSSGMLVVVSKTAHAMVSEVTRIGSAAMRWQASRREEKVKRLQERDAQPIPCPFCSEPINRNAKKCRHCNEYLDSSLRAPAAPAVAAQPNIVVNNVVSNVAQSNAMALAVAARGRKRFSPIMAFILSILIPGLGQLYTGRFMAGVVWFLFVLLGYICFIVPGVILHLICAFSAASTDPYS